MAEQTFLFGIGLFQQILLQINLNTSSDLNVKKDEDLDLDQIVSNYQRLVLCLHVSPPLNGSVSLDSFMEQFSKHSPSITLIYTCKYGNTILMKEEVHILCEEKEANENIKYDIDNDNNGIAAAYLTSDGIDIKLPLEIQVGSAYWGQPLDFTCELHLAADSMHSDSGQLIPTSRQSVFVTDQEEMDIRLLLEHNRYRPTRVPPKKCVYHRHLVVSHALALESKSVEIGPSSTLLLLTASNRHLKLPLNLHAVTAHSAESEQMTSSSTGTGESMPVDVSALYHFRRMEPLTTNLSKDIEASPSNINMNMNMNMNINMNIVTIPPGESYTFAFKISPRNSPASYLYSTSFTSNTEGTNVDIGANGSLNTSAGSEFLWHPSLMGHFRTPLSLRWSLKLRSSDGDGDGYSESEGESELLQDVDTCICHWTMGESHKSKSHLTSRSATIGSGSNGIDKTCWNTSSNSILPKARKEYGMVTPQPLPQSPQPPHTSNTSNQLTLKEYCGVNMIRANSNGSSNSISSGSNLTTTPRYQQHHQNSMQTTDMKSGSNRGTPHSTVDTPNNHIWKEVFTPAPVVLVSPQPRQVQTLHSIHSPLPTLINVANPNSILSGNLDHSNSSMSMSMSVPGEVLNPNPNPNPVTFRITIDGPSIGYGVVNVPLQLSVKILNVSNKAFIGLQLVSTSSTSSNGNNDNDNDKTELSTGFFISQSCSHIDGVLKPGEVRNIELTVLPLRFGQQALSGLYIRDPRDSSGVPRNYYLMQHFTLLILEKQKE
jgi:hypothetical protein